MTWQYRRRLSLTNRVMTLPYEGYYLRITADGKLLSEVDEALTELLRAAPALWAYNPPPAPADDTSKETDSPSLDIGEEQEEEVKPKRRRRATTKRAK
jgi:hypothetical protein